MPNLLAYCLPRVSLEKFKHFHELGYFRLKLPIMHSDCLWAQRSLKHFTLSGEVVAGLDEC
jgi:hypothetical protein